MKKFLRTRDIKFAMLLSIASLLGSQVAQAGEVYCPALDVIEAKPGAQKGSWSYKGTTTGAKSFEMGNIGIGRLEFDKPIRTMKSHGTLFCEYGPKPMNNPYLKYQLTRDSKDCHTVDAENNPVPNGEYGTHFECP